MRKGSIDLTARHDEASTAKTGFTVDRSGSKKCRQRASLYGRRGPTSVVTSRVPLDPSTKATLMKTMTCRQLGGPCDFAHHGDDANVVIKAQDRHLREAVETGATEHKPALRAMKGRWKRPISGMRWYRQAKRDFAALPDDRGRG
jgi:hypothetical protein